MKYRSLLSALVVVALGAMPAMSFAQGSATGPSQGPSQLDRQFVTKAMQSNASEIKAADLERNSSNASVRLFARTMIADHGQAVAQLAAIADQENIPYPKSGVVNQKPSEGSPPKGEPGSATAGNMSAHMMPARQYMQGQVAAHQQAIALYQNEAKNGSSQALRAYAAHTLPVLQQHLKMAQQFMSSGTVSPESTPKP